MRPREVCRGPVLGRFRSVGFTASVSQHGGTIRWDRFNSNKVCEITYARIQSKVALIKHFENSALSKEDPAYQPVVFASDVC